MEIFTKQIPCFKALVCVLRKAYLCLVHSYQLKKIRMIERLEYLLSQQCY